jgi:hypothetical protein
MTAARIPETHVHIHLPGLDLLSAQIQRMEQLMTAANDALVALKAQLADTTSDVLAKLAQLTEQLGEMPEDAAATLAEITEAVSALDTTVGDADGSDAPPADPEA